MATRRIGVVCSSAVAASTEALRATGGFADDPAGEDFVCCALLALDERVTISSRITASYIRRPDSRMGTLGERPGNSDYGRGRHLEPFNARRRASPRSRYARGQAGFARVISRWLSHRPMEATHPDSKSPERSSLRRATAATVRTHELATARHRNSTAGARQSND